MQEVFEWYTEVNNTDEITQGDIFLNLPIINIENESEILSLDNIEDYEAEISVEFYDYIILTQPCDLARPKEELKNVVLCKIHDLNKLKWEKKKCKEIIEGKRPQFYMLNENEKFNYKDRYTTWEGFNHHIVDFNSIQTISVEALKKYSSNINKRLRLLPPYREHLSQAFARSFMRIGLPTDIDKDSIEKYSKK